MNLYRFEVQYSGALPKSDCRAFIEPVASRGDSSEFEVQLSRIGDAWRGAFILPRDVASNGFFFRVGMACDAGCAWSLSIRDARGEVLRDADLFAERKAWLLGSYGVLATVPDDAARPRSSIGGVPDARSDEVG